MSISPYNACARLTWPPSNKIVRVFTIDAASQSCALTFGFAPGLPLSVFGIFVFSFFIRVWARATEGHAQRRLKTKRARVTMERR